MKRPQPLPVLLPVPLPVPLPVLLPVLVATLGASTFASCKGREGGSPTVRAAATAPTLRAARSDGAAGTAVSSPEFARDIERRRTAWIQQRPSREENKMTPERVRRMEMSRLELASLSQEEAATTMGLGEGDKSKLRQALIEFRDATLFRIEHPDAAGGGRSPKLEPYQNHQRTILGSARYNEFSQLEQQEREKLIAGRRAFRKSTGAPAAPTESPPGQ